MSSIIVPDSGLVLGPDGMPTNRPPATVGLNLLEGLGGVDSLSAIAYIADLRRRRERIGEITVGPGQVTLGLLEEVALFNAASYRDDELTEIDKAQIIAAVRKRWRKAKKRQSK